MDPTTYSFINSSYSINNGPPVHYPGDYSTDRVRDMGLDYLEEAAKHDKPFFVGSEWWRGCCAYVSLADKGPPSCADWSALGRPHFATMGTGQ